MESQIIGPATTVKMCVVQGAKLLNHIIATFTASSQLACVSLCSIKPDCLSINYNLVDKTCELNDKVATDYRAIYDFFTELYPDHIYYSTSVCWMCLLLYSRLSVHSPSLICNILHAVNKYLVWILTDNLWNIYTVTVHTALVNHPNLRVYGIWGWKCQDMPSYSVVTK